MYLIPLFNCFVQAARLGIPAEVWRLVDSVVEGGALQTAERAAELFPPVEVAMPSDVPLDDETAVVLRYVTYWSRAACCSHFFLRFLSRVL